jgi:hypothetical protein
MNKFIIYVLIFSVSLSASLTGNETKESMMMSYVEAYHRVMSPQPDPTAFLDLLNCSKQLFKTHPNLDLVEFLFCNGPTFEIDFILFSLMLYNKYHKNLPFDNVLIEKSSTWFKNPLIKMNLCGHHSQSTLLLLVRDIHTRNLIHSGLLLEYFNLRKKYIGLSESEHDTLYHLEYKHTSS